MVPHIYLRSFRNFSLVQHASLSIMKKRITHFFDLLLVVLVALFLFFSAVVAAAGGDLRPAHRKLSDDGRCERDQKMVKSNIEIEGNEYDAEWDQVRHEKEITRKRGMR